jgi:hypothetical protein
VIRRIFREIAEGRGYAKVAQGLNANRVPCPTGKRWPMTCVRELVFRELYRGRLVYGKTRWESSARPEIQSQDPGIGLDCHRGADAPDCARGAVARGARAHGRSVRLRVSLKQAPGALPGRRGYSGRVQNGYFLASGTLTF